MNDSNYFLDSNIFLRIVSKDNKKKTKNCERLIEAVKNGEMVAYTSTTVIAEVVWVSLRFYKITKEEVVRLVKALVTIKNLKIRDNSNSIDAFTLYEKYSVKFIDALIASDPWFKERKMKIVSYDKGFDKMNVERVEPDELL